MSVDYPIGPLDPWRVYRGDGPVTYTITDTDENGDPFDLTTLGDTWSCQARESADVTIPTFTIAVDDTDAATGSLVLTLTAEQTASMKSSSYVFDVQVVDDAGRVLTVYGPGKILVTKDVTR